MMNWYGAGMSGWGYLLMIANTLLFWGLLVAGVVVLVRYFGSASRHGGVRPGQSATPEQILAERFARGEIDEDEYRRRLAVLRGAPSA
jgi:putative membrane protein